MNRVFSGFYPNNVCGVVYQNSHRQLACQFTFACDGIPDVVNDPDLWERAKTIAARHAGRQAMAARDRQVHALSCLLGAPVMGERDAQACTRSACTTSIGRAPGATARTRRRVGPGTTTANVKRGLETRTRRNHISISSADIEARRRMRQRAGRGIVDAGRRDLRDVVERDAAGRFDHQLARHHRDRLSHHRDIEIVEQHDVGEAAVEHLLQLIERVDLDLDLDQVAGARRARAPARRGCRPRQRRGCP